MGTSRRVSTASTRGPSRAASSMCSSLGRLSTCRCRQTAGQPGFQGGAIPRPRLFIASASLVSIQSIPIRCRIYEDQDAQTRPTRSMVAKPGVSGHRWRGWRRSSPYPPRAAARTSSLHPSRNSMQRQTLETRRDGAQMDRRAKAARKPSSLKAYRQLPILSSSRNIEVAQADSAIETIKITINAGAPRNLTVAGNPCGAPSVI